MLHDTAQYLTVEPAAWGNKSEEMRNPIRLAEDYLVSPRFLLGAALSLAAGAALYQLTSHAIESDAEKRFRSVARIGQYTIEARIKSYTDVLRGTAGLFRAHPNATAEQFHDYVQQVDIKRNFPGIEVLNYAHVYTENERPAIEQSIRNQLHALGKRDMLYTIPKRGPGSTYTIMVYIEPKLGLWLDKLGMDLENRPYPRKALAESRDNNTMSASGTRVTILSGPNRHGLAMRIPIYRGGTPIDTVAQRRAAYIGTVGIGFGVDRLVSGVLETLPIKEVRLVLTDQTPIPASPGEQPQPTLLFDSDDEAAHRRAHAKDDDDLHVVLPIEFNKRTWIADFSIARADLYSPFDATYPWLTALAGAICTALLYALFQTMAASRRTAIEMAEEMTRELRTSKAKLQASHEKLRRLAAHAEQIKEGERKRIAREIHDDLGQNLLALRIDAEMLTSRTRDTHARLHARAQATLRQIDTTIRSVRQIINDLRPNVLDLGLNAAVDWLLSDFQRRTSIECFVVGEKTEYTMDDRCATALFRILQESLNNVARHAHATKVRIVLACEGGIFSMQVSDNGIGLPPGSRTRQGSFGLVGIEERVAMLGGRFSIGSATGEGTTLTVEVPVGAQAIIRSRTRPPAAHSERLSV